MLAQTLIESWETLLNLGILASSYPAAGGGAWVDYSVSSNAPISPYQAINTINGKYLAVSSSTVQDITTTSATSVLSGVGTLIGAASIVNGQFLVFDSDDDFHYSTNGTSWTTVTAWTGTSRSTWVNMAYGNRLGTNVYMAVRTDTGSAVYKSALTAGSWTSEGISGASNLAGIHYSSSLGMWIAWTGSGNVSGNVEIFTSTDGDTWTQRTIATGTNNYVRYIVEGNGVLVALPGSSGTGSPYGRYYTSTDGITWTSRSVGSTIYTDSATALRNISFHNGRFWVIGLTSGATNGISAYSTDGITWTVISGSTGPDNAVYSIGGNWLGRHSTTVVKRLE